MYIGPWQEWKIARMMSGMREQPQNMVLDHGHPNGPSASSRFNATLNAQRQRRTDEHAEESVSLPSIRQSQPAKPRSKPSATKTAAVSAQARIAKMRAAYGLSKDETESDPREEIEIGSPIFEDNDDEPTPASHQPQRRHSTQHNTQQRSPSRIKPPPAPIRMFESSPYFYDSNIGDDDEQPNSSRVPTSPSIYIPFDKSNPLGLSAPSSPLMQRSFFLPSAGKPDGSLFLSETTDSQLPGSSYRVKKQGSTPSSRSGGHHIEITVTNSTQYPPPASVKSPRSQTLPTPPTAPLALQPLRPPKGQHDALMPHSTVFYAPVLPSSFPKNSSVPAPAGQDHGLAFPTRPVPTLSSQPSKSALEQVASANALHKSLYAKYEQKGMVELFQKQRLMDQALRHKELHQQEEIRERERLALLRQTSGGPASPLRRTQQAMLQLGPQPSAPGRPQIIMPPQVSQPDQNAYDEYVEEQHRAGEQDQMSRTAGSFPRPASLPVSNPMPPFMFPPFMPGMPLPGMPMPGMPMPGIPGMPMDGAMPPNMFPFPFFPFPMPDGSFPPMPPGFMFPPLPTTPASALPQWPSLPSTPAHFTQPTPSIAMPHSLPPEAALAATVQPALVPRPNILIGAGGAGGQLHPRVSVDPAAPQLPPMFPALPDSGRNRPLGGQPNAAHPERVKAVPAGVSVAKILASDGRNTITLSPTANSKVPTVDVWQAPVQPPSSGSNSMQNSSRQVAHDAFLNQQINSRLQSSNSSQQDPLASDRSSSQQWLQQDFDIDGGPSPTPFKQQQHMHSQPKVGDIDISMFQAASREVEQNNAAFAQKVLKQQSQKSAKIPVPDAPASGPSSSRSQQLKPGQAQQPRKRSGKLLSPGRGADSDVEREVDDLIDWTQDLDLEESM